MNRYLKIKCIAFCVLAMTLAASGAAQAETIFLDCGGGKFTVDPTNNTVNNRPATINVTSIDWVEQIDPGTVQATSITSSYHLDRVTGTLSNYVTYHMTSGQNQTSGTDTYPCTVGSAPATKF